MLNFEPHAPYTKTMKQLISLVVFCIIVLGCSSDNGRRNPFLQEVGFRTDLNLNLPLYSPLTNPGNAIYVGGQGIGIRGIVVINTGFDQYRAFEASCPNHLPNNCSTMAIDGQIVVCSCESYEYSAFTGQQLNRPDDGERYFDMLEYRAVFSGSTVVVTN